MSCILALDLAKNAGYAVVDGSGVRACGSWALNADLPESGKRALLLEVRHVIQVQRLRSAIADVAAQFPDLTAVAVEREFGRGVGSRLLVSLYTAANEAAYVAGLPCLSITLGQWRKHIHGTAGKMTEFYKAEAMRICERDGVSVPDADAAEAVLIGRYVHQTIRVSPSTHNAKRAA